jgi:MerR family transcriptional regulator, light-induced transcriptional regulator
MVAGMGRFRENDSPEAHDARVTELGRAYASAVLAGDEIEAEQVIREALDADLSTAEIDDEIIAPALWLVGEMWERGEITVADEHLATEISIRVLALQREAQRVSRARSDRRVMLATPAGEQHSIALRMVGDLLRDAGYHVVMLGTDVPPGALAASARRHEPDVICLSSTMAGADQVLVSIHEIQREWSPAGFVVGGRGLTSRLRARPGIGVCERVSEAIDAVDAMVQRAELN